MSWLHVEDRGEVRWLTMDNPGRRNAIPMDGWPDLGEAFTDFDSSTSRVLVLTGANGDFCAGADLDATRVEELTDVADRHRRMKTVAAAATALHRVSKPTVAAVDGVAVGAGLNLAIGCDLVIASDRARFAEIFVRRGLVLDTGGAWLLPRVIGLQRAKEMALTGRIVEGAEAVDIGLVFQLVPAAELEQNVNELVERLLAGAPLPQSINKQMLNASYGASMADMLAWEGEAQSVMLGTGDAAEGILSFLEKRQPKWTGS